MRYRTADIDQLHGIWPSGNTFAQGSVTPHEAFVPFPFLWYVYIPESLWRGLTPAQQLLHLLWVKKLAPLYDDHRRIRASDLGDTDRRVIQETLANIAQRQVMFDGPFRMRDSTDNVTAFRAKLRLLDRPALTRVIFDLTGGDSCLPPRIYLETQCSGSHVKVVLEWRRKDDPARGSVFLYPDAASRERYHFGIAALNYSQFIAAGRALREYLPIRDD